MLCVVPQLTLIALGGLLNEGSFMRALGVYVMAFGICTVPGWAVAQVSGESRQIEVDGHRMHLVTAGAGSPTVVLEGGSGWSLEEWDRVQPELARFARVVAYDRPGLGASEACPKAETAERVARELHAALHAAGFSPPYVLVAHSMGGPYARVFTHLFPREVVGLVLIDPAPEHFYERVRAELPDLAAVIDNAPDAPHGAERAAVDTTLLQAAASDPMPAIPIVVLTRGQWGGAPPQLARIWTEEHERWVKRTPTARLVVAQKSGHVIPREQPALVVQAVQEVWARSQKR